MGKGLLHCDAPVVNESLDHPLLRLKLLVEFGLHLHNPLVEQAGLHIRLFLVLLESLLELGHHREKLAFDRPELVADVLGLAGSDQFLELLHLLVHHSLDLHKPRGGDWLLFLFRNLGDVIGLCLCCLSYRSWLRDLGFLCNLDRLLLENRASGHALEGILSYGAWHLRDHGSLSLEVLLSASALGERHCLLLGQSSPWALLLVRDGVPSPWTLFPLCQATLFPFHFISDCGGLPASWATRFQLDYCHLPGGLAVDYVNYGCLGFDLALHFVFHSVHARRLESIFKDEVSICMALEDCLLVKKNFVQLCYLGFHLFNLLPVVLALGLLCKFVLELASRDPLRVAEISSNQVELFLYAVDGLAVVPNEPEHPHECAGQLWVILESGQVSSMLHYELLPRPFRLNGDVVLDQAADHVSSRRLLPLQRTSGRLWSTLHALSGLNLKARLLLSRVQGEARRPLDEHARIRLFFSFLLLFELSRTGLCRESCRFFVHPCCLEFYFWNLG